MSKDINDLGFPPNKRPPKTHYLKCHPGPFEAVRLRKKKCDVRINDREYMEGDTLELHRYDPDSTPTHNGDELRVRVTHCLYGPAFGVVPEGVVVMSIEPY